MSASDYDLLRQKLDEIIDTAERFPEGVQDLIRQSLVEALLDGGRSDSTASAGARQVAASTFQPNALGASTIDRESAIEFSRYLTRYKGVKLNDMEFSAVVARFFTREISPERRLDSIGPEHLMAAVEVAGRRKRPASPVTTLNNAKNVGGYLEPRGKGVYGISEDGIAKLDKRLSAKVRLRPLKPIDRI